MLHHSADEKYLEVLKQAAGVVVNRRPNPVKPVKPAYRNGRSKSSSALAVGIIGGLLPILWRRAA